jgi:hypothetical protein
MDIRVPVGTLFVSYGILLSLYALFGGPAEPRHMLAGLSANLVSGLAMFSFGGILQALSRAGGSRIRRATASPEGRAIEEREKRAGLEE